VLTLYYFACDAEQLEDMFPAMTGLLSIRLSGSSWRIAGSGARQPVPDLSILAPSNHAALIGAAGPFHVLGAVLSPRGWSALVGLHAGEHADGLFDGEALLGPEWRRLTSQLQSDHRAGAATPTELAGRLADQIAAGLRPLDPRHDNLIREVGQWLAASLDPSLDDLYARCAYSARQVQRLVERYYGCTPKQLVRKFRALRVFAMLMTPGLADEQAAGAVDLYYDQSHLIREFKRFVGRTPRQLQTARLPVLSALLEQRNYRPLWPEAKAQPDG
jgi:AraC-like DNA-binding protein